MENAQQRYQRKRQIRELVEAPELEPLALGELAALELVGAHSRRESAGVSSAHLDAASAALAMTEQSTTLIAASKAPGDMAGVRRAAVACAYAQGWTMKEIAPQVGCGKARAFQLFTGALSSAYLARRRRAWPALHRDAVAEIRELWRDYSKHRPHIDGTCKRRRCKLCREHNQNSVAAKAYRELEWERGAPRRAAQAAERAKRTAEIKAERAEHEAKVERMREQSRETLRAALALEDEAERSRAFLRFSQDWWPTERQRIASGIVEPDRLARLIRDAHRQRALDAGARCEKCGGDPEVRAPAPSRDVVIDGRPGVYREAARLLGGASPGPELYDHFLCFGCADPADYPHVDGGWVPHLRDKRGWPEVAERARGQIERAQE